MLDSERNPDGERCVVIFDFKKNLVIGEEPVEESYRFREQPQRIVLGFVVLPHSEDGKSVEKRYVILVYDVLNSDR